MAAGLTERKLSGPPSITQPSTHSVSITPPRRGRDSIRVAEMPACARYQAAERPEMPPPMIVTRGMPPLRASRMEFPHHLHRRAHVLHGRFRKDSMAHVEDMPGP